MQTSKIIELFNSNLESTNVKSFDEINSQSMKYGYIVHPKACTQSTLDWIRSNHRDINSAFYKSWNDVILKTRFELYIDQIMHYASTYGTDFQEEAYLPAGQADIPELKLFKVIGVITEEELQKRCLKMLYAGIALKQEIKRYG